MNSGNVYRTTHHADPGHGWAWVPTADLVRLGIADKITRYSYLSSNGSVAYLEEDCDYMIFVRALAAHGLAVVAKTRHTNGDSPIRAMRRYHPDSIRPDPQLSTQLAQLLGEYEQSAAEIEAGYAAEDERRGYV